MSRLLRAWAILAMLSVLVSACSGGGGSSPTASPSPTPVESESAAPSAPEATPSPTPNSDEATLDAPSEIEAGSDFQVAWTGPNGRGDYITIVASGATEWTAGDDYFDTANGSPGSLTAPTAPGAYELWYVSGEDESIAARVSITVTPFTGSLLAPDEVPAGTEFDIAWNGPDASGDYVTIVMAGADAWAGEPYFYTAVGNPGKLYAPMKGGAYEIWYVAGVDDSVQARLPITVLPLEITLEAPDEVQAGAQFQVEWTGPDGHRDYITIVPAGSAEGAYLSYAYTDTGSPVTLTAPDEPGEHEIWYASDRVPGIFARVPITVTP